MALQRISIDQFRINFQQGVPMFLIDARREQDWRDAVDTAMSAVRISLEGVVYRAGEVRYGCLAVVFCNCPNEESSMKVADILRQNGREARALIGGYDAWKSAGMPIVSKQRDFAA